MSSLLLTRPNHDDYTCYLYHWSKQILALATSKGMHVTDVHDKKVTRKEVQSRITKLSPELLLLNGHGSEDVMTGHDKEAILDAQNAGILKGTIAYAISCLTAVNLGPLSVSKGAKAYIGFSREHVIFYDKTKMTNPLNDKDAANFIEPALAVSVSLIKGHTVEESYNASLAAHKRNLRAMVVSNANASQTPEFSALFWNMRSLKYHGNGSATLT